MDDVFTKWVSKYKIVNNKLPLSYIHLDPKLTSRFKFNNSNSQEENFQNLQKYLVYFCKKYCNKEHLENHCFLPLINIFVPKFKYIKDKKTGKRKLHKKESNRPYKLLVRPIMYASHTDALIYSYYSALIENEYEKWIQKENLDDVIVGYRKIKNDEQFNSKGKSSVDHAIDVFKKIDNRLLKKVKNTSVICMDIKSFFDKLDHENLRNNLEKLLGINVFNDIGFNYIFKSLTSYSFIKKKILIKEVIELRTNKKVELKKITKKQLKTTNTRKLKTKFNCICTMKEFNDIKNNIKINNAKAKKKIKDFIEKDFIEKNKEICGIPQGTPMSGLLANIYLMFFDKAILEFTKLQGGFYKRYSDDIVLICSSDKLNVFKNKITEQITKFRLEIKESKTSIVNFNAAKINQPYLSYLGLDYNGKKIIIRQNTISRFYSKLLSYKNFKNKYSINSPFAGN